MQYIHNRTLLVVKVKQPFIDWLKKNDQYNELQHLTVEEINCDDTVYLVRMCSNDTDKTAVINAHLKTIFESRLRFWESDISAWPIHRDYETFKRWFDVEFHQIIIDLEVNNYILRGYET